MALSFSLTLIPAGSYAAVQGLAFAPPPHWSGIKFLKSSKSLPKIFFSYSLTEAVTKSQCVAVHSPAAITLSCLLPSHVSHASYTSGGASSFTPPEFPASLRHHLPGTLQHWPGLDTLPLLFQVVHQELCCPSAHVHIPSDGLCNLHASSLPWRSRHRQEGHYTQPLALIIIITLIMTPISICARVFKGVFSS